MLEGDGRPIIATARRLFDLVKASHARQCIVCLEHHTPATPGLYCDNGHFTCTPTLANIVRAMDGGDLCRDRGGLRCPGMDEGNRRCRSIPWRLEDLCTVLDATDVLVHMHHVKELQDELAGKSNESTVQAAHSTGDQRLLKFRDELHDSMLFRCPRCRRAQDPDPDGCIAVRCVTCGQHFCWMCFAKAAHGTANHEHAQRAHGDLWPNRVDKEEAHAELRRRAVESFIHRRDLTAEDWRRLVLMLEPGVYGLATSVRKNTNNDNNNYNNNHDDKHNRRRDADHVGGGGGREERPRTFTPWVAFLAVGAAALTLVANH